MSGTIIHQNSRIITESCYVVDGVSTLVNMINRHKLPTQSMPELFIYEQKEDSTWLMNFLLRQDSSMLTKFSCLGCLWIEKFPGFEPRIYCQKLNPGEMSDAAISQFKYNILNISRFVLLRDAANLNHTVLRQQMQAACDSK